MAAAAEAEAEAESTVYARIVARLLDLPGYTWDLDLPPFHSSYDNWHFFGHQKATRERPTSRGQSSINSTSSKPPDSSRPAFARNHKSSGSDVKETTSQTNAPDLARDRAVVCRVSTHVLRLEREFQLSKIVVKKSDPDCKHFVRPIDFVRLPPKPGNTEPLVASIFEAPGSNYLPDLLNFRPNAYRVMPNPESGRPAPTRTPTDGIPLLIFLDFAVSATECLEIIHHGHELVHGEIRGDAFHFAKSGSVRLINFGSGARSFENGLTSAGWSTLAKEVGIQQKLAYIAPEQTGRLPAEPDSRTDIYSLGILFYSMLVGETGFEANTALDVMTNVLNKRISPVSSKRMDVPEALSALIQKMTQRNIENRYHSTSGLKYDLIRIREILSEGDGEGLKAFQIGSQDVNCFFNLPRKQIGRNKERQLIIETIERASRRLRNGPHFGQVLNNLSSSSSYSDPRFDAGMQLDDIVSDSTSSRGSEGRNNGAIAPPFSHQRSQDSVQSQGSVNDDNQEARPQLGSRLSGENRPSYSYSMNDTSSLSRSNQSDNASLFRTMSNNQAKLRRRGRCEVLTISGSSGLGKSRLVQDCQSTARSLGYFATAKFDPAKRAPFEPILRLMSSM
jgi:serine/threonine protein kinase